MVICEACQGIRERRDVRMSHMIHVRPHSEALQGGRKCLGHTGDEWFHIGLHFNQEVQRKSESDKLTEPSEADDAVRTQVCFDVAVVMNV